MRSQSAPDPGLWSGARGGLATGGGGLAKSFRNAMLAVLVLAATAAAGSVGIAPQQIEADWLRQDSLRPQKTERARRGGQPCEGKQGIPPLVFAHPAR